MVVYNNKVCGAWMQINKDSLGERIFTVDGKSLNEIVKNKK